MLKRLRREELLSIHDIADDTLVDKNHPWVSCKPSKRVLEMLFYQGLFAVSARQSMLKTYDLMARHFGDAGLPRPATVRQILAYKLDHALCSQGLISLDSICHPEPSSKTAIKALIDSRVRARKLMPLTIAGNDRVLHWAEPATLEAPASEPPHLVHILLPFDLLIIQLKRLSLVFGYDHLFEAYLTTTKRHRGYFALPRANGRHHRCRPRPQNRPQRRQALHPARDLAAGCGGRGQGSGGPSAASLRAVSTRRPAAYFVVYLGTNAVGRTTFVLHHLGGASRSSILEISDPRRR
ncbi:MAG: winged helix DNA-binding domain-containing protein [Candidatus Devosia symbiotica]|nr:winged helix DNA-binding domain-containing protein [Candidatus Devosia symbiotica]